MRGFVTAALLAATALGAATADAKISYYSRERLPNLAAAAGQSFAGLVNGGFENGASPWTLSGSAALNSKNNGSSDLTAVHGGAWSIRLYHSGSASQSFATTPGASYSVTYWSWQYGSHATYASVDGTKVAGAGGSNSNGEWFKMTGTFVAKSASSVLTLGLNDSGATAHVDDASVTKN